MLIKAIAPEMRRKIVGGIIKRRRHALGVSIAGMAEQLGLKSPPFLIAIEKGTRPIPTGSCDVFFEKLKFNTTDMHVVLALSYPALWEVMLSIYRVNVSPDWARTIEVECFQAIRKYREQIPLG